MICLVVIQNSGVVTFLKQVNTEPMAKTSAKKLLIFSGWGGELISTVVIRCHKVCVCVSVWGSVWFFISEYFPFSYCVFTIKDGTVNKWQCTTYINYHRMNFWGFFYTHMNVIKNPGQARFSDLKRMQWRKNLHHLFSLYMYNIWNSSRYFSFTLSYLVQHFPHQTPDGSTVAFLIHVTVLAFHDVRR